MPELPEVETIRRDLERLALGQRITSVEVIFAPSVRADSISTLEKSVLGQKLVAVERRAKLLILHLASRDRLLVHLKMSGRLVYVAAREPIDRHTRLILGLSDGYALRFIDMRKFGFVKLIPREQMGAVSELDRLGPEILAKDFTEEHFVNLIMKKRTSRRSIKAMLLDQSFIGGIGNIYADEILYEAGIFPGRPTGSLTPGESSTIYRAAVNILESAIAHRGTSFSLYVDASGRQGNFFAKLSVYGRQDQACPRCAGKILKIRHAGRGTHYCADCQPDSHPQF